MTKLKSTMSFNKIKINDKKTEVHYVKHTFLEDEDGVRNTNVPLVSDVKPHKAFFDAFQALKKYAVPYMELSPFKKADKDVLDRFVVTGVSITEDMDTVKIIVSMTRYLSTGKAHNLNTPLIDLEHEDFEYIEDFREAYWTMIEEAKGYLHGKNGENQLKLIFDAA